MQKKQIFNIAGSNIEMLGSDVERQCKEAAGKTEKAWIKAGKVVGLDIWRIENFKVIASDRQTYGSFYKGDSYIVLNTYKEKNNDKLKYDLHFWLGDSTTQDEAGTAAYKTVELDDVLGGSAVHHRELCGRESGTFLSYFKESGGIKLLEGGVESGFNHVEPDSYQPRLLHLKGLRNIRITQVELTGESLRCGDCFVLDAGLIIFQWQGKESNRNEKVTAHQYAISLRSERMGKPDVIVIDQLDKEYPPKFWELLGGQTEISEDDTADEDWEKQCKKKMFRLSDENGGLEFILVGTGKKVTSKLLNSDDVFIVDVGSEIYVWIGEGASEGEKNSALSQGQKYLKDNDRPAWLPLQRILEGSENKVFLQLIQPKVSRKLKKSTGGPCLEQKGDMGGYLVQELGSNGTLILHWSVESVSDSLAYFRPSKSVPKYKFKAKGGKAGIATGCTLNKKNYYQGWCTFIKRALLYNSTFIYTSKDVRLYEQIGSKITEIPRGIMKDLSEVESLAAIPGRSTIFDGLKFVDKGTFLNKSQAIGHAVNLVDK